MANGSEPAAAGTVAGAAALRRVGLGLLSAPRGEASGERSEGMPTRSVYLGRCGADVGEIWGRHGGDMGEIWVRYG